jgi:high-affinity iron transporter
LQRLSLTSDHVLAEEFPDKKGRLFIAALRLWPDSSIQNSSDFLKVATTHLDLTLTLYSQGNREKSRDAALLAYLEGVEPLEARLRALDPQFVVNLESAMMAVRSAIQSEVSTSKMGAVVDSAKALLRQAEDLMGRKSLPPWSIFLATVGILMREGFEALLVIVAILGVVRATATPKAAAYVHGGWILAVAAGFAAWFLSEWVAQLSGAGREMTEGISSLFAVAVLLYMGFWMHSKSEIDKWKAFIHSKLKGTLTEKGLLAIGGFSFLVVFREAFETVLFLSALNLEGEGTGKIILAGTLFSLALTLGLAWLFLNTSRKLPTSIFFSISSFIMAILAVILAGKGTHALQEAGLFTVTTSPLHFRVDLLGWYPTLETWAAQLVIFILAGILLAPRKNSKIQK